MSHPTDLLVDLVDGSISAADRRAVEAHLAACARCTGDVALAASGRDALRGLEGPQVPPGLLDAAIAEAEHRARETAPEVSPLRRRARETPAWQRWAGAAAAAAVIGLLVVAVLPNVGDDGDDVALEAAAERGDATAPPRLETETVDYDVPAVQALATSYRSAFQASAGTGTDASLGPESAAAMPAAADEEQPTTEDALACLDAAVPGAGARPTRLIAARYEGAPAFLGVYLSGPGAGQPPDTVTVWVVARNDCRILTTTTASL